MTDEPVPDDWYYEQVLKRLGQLYDRYDRTVLTLAGGALVLSVSFASDIAAQPPIDSWSLAWAWGLLVGSLVFVTTSYLPSIMSHRARFLDRDSAADRSGFIAEGLSVSAGALLIGGLSFLARFAFVNLG